VAGLPGQVRRPQRERDRGAGQQPRGREQPPAAPVGHQGDRADAGELQHGGLVLETHPDGQADQRPQPHVSGAGQAREEQQRQRPEQQVVGCGAMEVPDRDDDARAGDAGRRQELRAAATAEFAGEHPADHRHRPDRQRRQQPQAEQGVAEGEAGDRRQRRGQRRLVDVPPGQVLGGHQEVELVAVVAVASGDGQLDRDQHSGDHHEPADGWRRQPRLGCRPGGLAGGGGHRC